MIYKVANELCRNCVSQEDGEILALDIRNIIMDGTEVTVDFTNVRVVTNLFLKSSFGKLIQDFDKKELNRLIKITGLSKKCGLFSKIS